MESTVKVLSLKEPWASLIAFGPKRIETRSWRTRYRGPLYIHASAARPSRSDPHIRELSELLPGREPACGLILCRCLLTGCVPMDEGFLSSMTDPTERLCGEYAPGRFAWLLGDVQVLSEPVPAKGRLGIWTFNLPDSQL